MSAAPVGYEAFKNTRRRLITLLCFVLASSMAMGISVYVDSYSVHEWDKNLDVGDVALVVYSYDGAISNYLDDIREISGITKAALLRSEHERLVQYENFTAQQTTIDIWGGMISPDQDLLDVFPNYLNLVDGRFPANESEIAVLDAVRRSYDLSIGDILNVTGLYVEREVSICGFYEYGSFEGNSPYYYYYPSIAVVYPSLLHPQYSDQTILADINRAPLTPYNPTGSLQYTNRIDERIRELDPFYNPPYEGSSLYVNNYLSQGITSYIFWVQTIRITEILRSAAIFLLAALVIFLAVRYNTNERRYERNILISRGASLSDLESAVTREVFIIACFSTILGYGLGILFSRVAISATGYFTFDFQRLITEPFLLSFESFIISAVVGVVLPLITLAGYRAVYSTKKSVDEQRGKLAKIARGLGFIRWDVLVVVLSGLVLIALMSSVTIIASIPFLSLLLPIVPLALFLGVASLTMKAFKAGAVRISNGMRRLVGEIPASVGVRRISKGASSAGAAAMVLVLAISLSWNSAIIDSSLPITTKNQAYLSIGADLAFELDDEYLSSWDDFMTNVTSHPNVSEASLTSQTSLSLSADYGGFAAFLAVHPENYSRIGYTYEGVRFNESRTAEMLRELELIPGGAIISTDIARRYDFEVGDVMSASNLDEYRLITISFQIIGIVRALPEMPTETYDYYPIPGIISPFIPRTQVVGQNRILINRDYLGDFVTLENETSNFLCVDALTDTNETATAESLLNRGGGLVVAGDAWDSVEQHVTELLTGTAYSMNRAVDTMLTILTVGTIMGAFTVYATEGVRARRREIALLRSMGGSKRLIASTQAAEMVVLAIYGIGLLAGYAPLFLSTSVVASAGMATIGYKVYPVSIFPVIPWSTIGLVLLFFIIAVVGFILFVSILSSRVNITNALNASWAEAGPFGGDV